MSGSPRIAAPDAIRGRALGILQAPSRLEPAVSQPTAAGAIVYAKDIARLARFYADVADLEIVHEVADHVALESETYELVIVAIPAATAARIVITTPPARRENTAFKLVLPVESLAEARAAAQAAGGGVDAPEREWEFQGSRVCDGFDPEGNVIQLREIVETGDAGE
jgi:predicted enzyme related to lactoylglutathione lyase